MQRRNAQGWIRAYAQIWLDWFPENEEARSSWEALKAALELFQNAAPLEWESLPVAWQVEQQAWPPKLETKFLNAFQSLWLDWLRTGRLHLFPRVVERIEIQLSLREGRLPLVVYSAHPLDAAQKAEFEAQLSHALGRVLCTWRVDPSLRAGYRLESGDWILDCSGRHFLHQFRDHLAGVVSLPPSI